MALSKTTLNVLSILYLGLILAVWLGWQFETDRRMRRDRDSIQQELQATGMSAWQAYNITYGMAQAYNHATSYASAAIIAVVVCTQGMTSILISSLSDEKAKVNVPSRQ
jgi:hypothetical protein